MAFISDIIGYGEIVLPAIALVLLACGPISRYFPLFLYLASAVGAALALGWIFYVSGPADPLYYQVYWGSEFLLDPLRLLLIVSLIGRALEDHPSRKKITVLMTGILVIVLAIPFVVFTSPIFGRHWNQSVAQLLNFGAALMNLALWSALIMTKRRDPQLLTVSAGLGVTVAGAAMMLGVRQFTAQGDPMRIATDYAYRVGQLAGPLIWCWAFWPFKRRNPPQLPFKVPPFKAPTSAAG